MNLKTRSGLFFLFVWCKLQVLGIALIVSAAEREVQWFERFLNVPFVLIFFARLIEFCWFVLLFLSNSL